MTPPPLKNQGPKTIGRKLCILIPLVAVAVIAPTACYYEDYGYGYQDAYGGGGQVYRAAPYGGYGSTPYQRSRPSYGYNSRPYGYSPYGYSSRSNSQHRHHEDYRHQKAYSEHHQKATAQRAQAMRRQEEMVEGRRESQKEGWKYEDRGERRKRGAEEPFEERKKR